MALSTTAAIEVADVETYLGITTGTGTALLEQLIEGATEELEAMLQGTLIIQRSVSEELIRRPGGVAAWTDEWWAGNRVRTLYLRHRPVVSVTSIADDDGNTISADDYAVDEDQGRLVLSSTWDRPVTSSGATGSWTVTYIAGIAADRSAVPERIKQALRLLVAWRYGQRSSAVASERVGDLAVTYRDPGTAGGIPAEIRSLVAGDIARWV